MIDRTAALYPFLADSAQKHNSQAVDEQGKAILPRIEISKIDQAASDDVDPAVVLELSDRIRRGELDAYAVIPPAAIEVPRSKTAPAPAVEFHSDNPNDDLLRNWLTAAVNSEVRSRRLRSSGIDQSIVDRIDQPLSVENLGLVDRQITSGGGPPAIKAAQKIDMVRTMLVPAVLMFAMFFVVLTSTPSSSIASSKRR